MTNIIQTEIRDSRRRVPSITLSSMEDSNAVPCMAIESNKSISITSGNLLVDNSIFALEGKTILEVVKFLRGESIDASLTDIGFGASPAILLQDFSNLSIEEHTLSHSPTSMHTLFGKYISRMVSVSSAYVSREVIGCWTNGASVDYNIHQDNIFYNSSNVATCLIKHTINKYYINISRSKCFTSSEFISSQDSVSPQVNQVLESINKLNKDTA